MPVTNSAASNPPYLFTPGDTSYYQALNIDLQAVATSLNAVVVYGADPTGATDSTAAINAALASLPASGGTVFLPGGTYTISSTINLGNGTSTTQSTQQGVYLVGAGNLQQGSGPCTTLSWAGASGGAMVNVLGPIQDWGVKHLAINGQGIAGFGLQAVAACGGEVDAVTVLSCTTQGFKLFAYPPGGTGHPDSQFNDINNLTVFLPASNGVGGILLDGDITNGANNSSFNTFRNCSVIAANSSVVQDCYYLKGCDSNQFICCSAFGGGSQTIGVVFDYNSVGDAGAWPANNTFMDFDTSVVLFGGASYFNVGVPGQSARPNRFFGISDTNSETYPTVINTTYCPEFIPPDVLVTGQTGSIGTTQITFIIPYVTGLYRANFYVATTVAGTGGTSSVALNLGWQDEEGFRTFTSSSIALNGLTNVGGVTAFRVKAGVDHIYYSTTIGGSGTTGFQYLVQIKLEKLY